MGEVRNPLRQVRIMMVMSGAMALGGFALAVAFAAAGYLLSALIMGASVAFAVGGWGETRALYRRIKQLEPPKPPTL